MTPKLEILTVLRESFDREYLRSGVAKNEVISDLSKPLTVNRTKSLATTTTFTYYAEVGIGSSWRIERSKATLTWFGRLVGGGGYEKWAYGDLVFCFEVEELVPGSYVVYARILDRSGLILNSDNADVGRWFDSLEDGGYMNMLNYR